MPRLRSRARARGLAVSLSFCSRRPAEVASRLAASSQPGGSPVAPPRFAIRTRRASVRPRRGLTSDACDASTRRAALAPLEAPSSEDAVPDRDGTRAGFRSTDGVPPTRVSREILVELAPGRDSDLVDRVPLGILRSYSRSCSSTAQKRRGVARRRSPRGRGACASRRTRRPASARLASLRWVREQDSARRAARARSSPPTRRPIPRCDASARRLAAVTRPSELVAPAFACLAGTSRHAGRSRCVGT